jgi:hypothetical protein
MKYDIRLEQQGSLLLAVVRRRASLQELSQTFQTPAALCGKFSRPNR